MRLFLITTLLLFAITAFGQKKSFVSAAPYSLEVTQPDGSKLKVMGMGDEFSHYSVTEDGYTILKNSKGFYEFAMLTKAGGLDYSGQRAHNPEQRDTSERNFLNGVSKFQKPQFSSSAIQSATTQSTASQSFPSTGNRRVLLLLIQYPDLTSTRTVTDFDNLMNLTNYNGTGSFSDYYAEASNGTLDLTVDVFGWYTAQNDYLYYGDDNGDMRAQELVAEAIDAAEAAGVDFSLYDNDHNGTLDNLMVVHSGPGAEEGSRTEYIWSHSWSLYSSYDREYDGVYIRPYIIQPETRSYGMVGIGVFCHEFGHALGLPDLYDTDYTSEGLGNWCLMAGGAWLNNERTPAMLSAWTRQDLGWINPVAISSNGDYQLSPAATGTQCYKLTTPNSNEYFLLENRYKTGFDAYLPGSGLAIYHVNSNKWNNIDENNKLVDLEEADGKNDLDFDNTNRGDAGDVFPGSTNNTAFNDQTNPNSLTYDLKSTGIDINTIYLSSSTLYFTVGGTLPQGIDLTSVSASNAVSINSTTVEVDMEVKNTASENAGAFQVGFYLSSDATVTTSDYLIGTKSVAGLISGASAALTLSKDVLTVTPTIPDGTYYVGYIIDYLEAVEELDETNNKYVYSGDQVQIITKANLTYVASFNSFSINDYDVSVSLSVENDGTIASEASNIAFYLSGNSTITTSDFQIGTVNLSSMNPGESTQKSFAINVLDEFPDLPEGSYYLGYLIDYQNVVAEISETDNSYCYLTKKLVHTLYPNLTYISDANQLEITSSRINLGLEVVNNGEKTSSACRVGFYLSDDASISTGDYLMGYADVGSLAVGSTSPESISAAISSLEGHINEGMYYLGYIVDYQNINDELDEGDNKYIFLSSLFHYCPPDVSEINREICEGESVSYNGQTYTETGSYEFVYTSQSGCDSVIVLNVNVYPTHNIVLNEAICSGESYRVGQSSYSKTGVYTQTLTNQYGCDSVVTLYLNVMEPVYVELNESICSGENVSVAGIDYDETGTYVNVLSSSVGCDSTVTLHLSVYQPSDTLLVKTICDGDSIVVGSSSYKTTGVYTELLKNYHGCDSLVTLDLVVNPSYEMIYEDIICEGDTSWINGLPYTESGEYVTAFTTELGCDSTIVLKLTVNPVHDTLLNISVCEGESINVGNSIYSETGIYVENLTNQFGCDSIVTLNLIVNPVDETVLDETICEGDSIVVGASVYKTTGSFTDLLTNQYGCDSTVFLTLTVNPVNFVEIDTDICEGESYLFGGDSYSSGGTYYHTFSNRFGCDSVVTLQLNVNPLPIVDLGDDFTMFSSQSILLDAGAGYSSYIWNNGLTTPEITITKAQGLGTKSYSVTVINEYQCSSADEVAVTVYDDSMEEGDPEPDLKLFPNPSDGVLKVLIEEITGIYTIRITSDNSSVVYTEQFSSPGIKFVQQLNLSQLISGYYTLSVITENKIMTERLVILKQ